ncbi:MAG: TlpA disulfide reductase family protein [Balneolales bacterium]
MLLVAGTAYAQLPDFELRDLQNRSQSYEDVKGSKVTLIDFWATWCAPCIEAIPELIALQSRYKEQGLEVIGINIDSQRNLSKVRPFVNSFGINYTILLDPDSEVMPMMQLSVMPTVLVVDSHTNNIINVYEGYRPGVAAFIEEDIKKILDDE